MNPEIFDEMDNYYTGPSVDPMDHAMIEHLIEFETEMFRLECRQRISNLSYPELERRMVDLHGEDWCNAL